MPTFKSLSLDLKTRQHLRSCEEAEDEEEDPKTVTMFNFPTGSEVLASVWDVPGRLQSEQNSVKHRKNGRKRRNAEGVEETCYSFSGCDSPEETAETGKSVTTLIFLTSILF